VTILAPSEKPPPAPGGTAVPPSGRADERRAPTWLGVVYVVGGCIPIAIAALGIDAGFRVPRPVVAILGMLFVTAGLTVIRSAKTQRASAPGGDLLVTFMGAVMLTAFAAIFGWLLLFTDRSEWSGSGTFPLGWFPDLFQAVLFYGLLGGFVVAISVAALFTWRAVVRGVAARLPGPVGAALPWAVGLVALAGAGWGGWQLFGPAPSDPPLLHLAFDGSLEDRGPYRAKATTWGEVEFHPGIVGQALFVSGTWSWIDYPLPPAIDLTRSASIELWVRRDDWVNPYVNGSSVQTIATVGPFVVNLQLLVPREAARSVPGDRSPARYRFEPSGRVGDVRATARGVAVPARTWTHVALVYDRAWSAARLYVDGRRVARAGVFTRPDVVRYGSLRIGTWHAANQAFRGEVDELKLYGYALGEAAIRASATRAR
jgi:concanavalin A-like lectin/glucanase superfamily protein